MHNFSFLFEICNKCTWPFDILCYYGISIFYIKDRKIHEFLQIADLFHVFNMIYDSLTALTHEITYACNSGLGLRLVWVLCIAVVDPSLRFEGSRALQRPRGRRSILPN